MSALIRVPDQGRIFILPFFIFIPAGHDPVHFFLAGLVFFVYVESFLDHI